MNSLKHLEHPNRALCERKALLDPQSLPDHVVPKGMTTVRRWYLFEEIARFCSSPETASVTCPRPSQPKVSSNPSTSHEASNTEDGTKTKRKRACSHCHVEGHTKTN